MLWDKIYNFFNKDIWHIDVSSIGRFKALIVKFLRLSYIIAREFYEANCLNENPLKANTMVF